MGIFKDLTLGRLLQIILVVLVFLLLIALMWQIWYDAQLRKAERNQEPAVEKTSKADSSKDTPSKKLANAAGEAQKQTESKTQDNQKPSQAKKEEDKASSDKPASSETQKSDRSEQSEKNKKAAEKAKQAQKDLKKYMPTFQATQVEPGGKIRVAGFASQGWSIEILSLGKRIGKVVVKKKSGEWVYVSKKNLKPGSHELKLVAISPDGKTRLASEQAIKFTIAKEQNIRPKVVRVEKGKAPFVLQEEKKIKLAQNRKDEVVQKQASDQAKKKKKDSDQNKTKTKTETKTKVSDNDQKQAKLENKKDKAENTFSQPLISVGGIQYKKKNNKGGILSIIGDGVPGVQLRVYVNKKRVGTSRVGQSGEWVFRKQIGFEKGGYDIRAEQVDKSGDIVAFAEKTYRIKEVKETSQSKTALKDINTHTGSIKKSETSQKASNNKKTQSRSEVKTANVTGAKDAIGDLIKKHASGKKNAKVTQRKRSYQRAQKRRRSRVVIVRRGDTLWGLAVVHYNNGLYYQRIYYRNRRVINDPDWIYPGQRLVLPKRCRGHRCYSKRRW